MTASARPTARSTWRRLLGGGAVIFALGLGVGALAGVHSDASAVEGGADRVESASWPPRVARDLPPANRCPPPAVSRPPSSAPTGHRNSGPLLFFVEEGSGPGRPSPSIREPRTWTL